MRLLNLLLPVQCLVVCLAPYILTGCADYNSESRIKKEAIGVAVDYAKNQLNNPERKDLKDGTIMLGDTLKRYFIQPSKVYIGLIDDDGTKDAIVSVELLQRYGPELTEHLIILNSNGKFMMIRSVEADMKILSVKDRIITADVPTHPVNNPLHNCPVCREVVKYQFMNGELVRMK
jgi:hypothetical protein